MSPDLLWQLYRRLLAEQHLLRHLPPARGTGASTGLGIAAALTQNLQPGDTLGLPAADLTTRYLCGMPLAHLKTKPTRPGRRKVDRWTFAADAEHGLLPGTGEEQASLAVGTALAARLHGTGRITVLVESVAPSAARRASAAAAGVPAWASAVDAAIAFHLPLLFLSSAPAAEQPRAGRAPTRLPAIPVDRYDTLALYRVIYESAARARSGGGPTWIECCRWPLQSASDDAETSALANMEQALRVRKLYDRRQHRQLEESLLKEIGNRV